MSGFALRATPGQASFETAFWKAWLARVRLRCFAATPGQFLFERSSNKNWWAAWDSNPPPAAMCGRGRGSPAIDHSLVVVRHRARRARVTRDHRIKSPPRMQL